MSKELQQKTVSLNKKHAKRKRNKLIAVFLSAAVTAATIITLILPAITMSADCGIEAHTHGDECYDDITVPGKREIVCGFENCPFTVIHKHDEFCYDAEGNLICTLPEVSEHRHGDECYTIEKTLNCGLEESTGHVHYEACYADPRQPVCGMEESEEHHHTEKCYESPRTPICGLEENEEHQHTEECYENPRELICSMEAGEGAHTHCEECYEETRTLICGIEELVPEAVLDSCTETDVRYSCSVVAHQHNEQCIRDGEPHVERILICEKQEHVHADECSSGPAKELAFSAETEDGLCVSLFVSDKDIPDHCDDHAAEMQLCIKEIKEDESCDSAGYSDPVRSEAILSAKADFENEQNTTVRLFEVILLLHEEEIQPTGPVRLAVSGSLGSLTTAYSLSGSSYEELTSILQTSEYPGWWLCSDKLPCLLVVSTMKEDGETIDEPAPSVQPVEGDSSSRGFGDSGTVTTADSRADGITLNLFDYYGYNLDTWGNNVTSPVYNGINSGRNVNNDLLFFGTGEGGSTNGINHYTQGAVALQGIVNRTLTNGYPTLRTNGSSLSYLFDLTPNGTTKTVYADVNHLFQKDENGYYRYDSDRNYAYYGSNAGGGNFTVYNNTYRNSDGSSIGFFPFNDYDTRYTNVKPDYPNHYNHHFGLTMAASFYMPENGKVNGEDMIFDFSGDDDVWVFIDDVLVLDIGGIHEAVHGSINFATGAVTVGSARPASCAGGTAIGTNNTLQAIFAAAGRTYDGSAYSEHTISFFYLERGGCYSNCSLTFNLNVFTERALEIEKRIEGEASDQLMNTEFKFRIYFGNGSNGDEYEAYRGPAQYSDGRPVTFAEDGSFTLKAGQKIILPDIPDFKRYYIEELDISSEFFPEVEINGELCEPIYSSGSEALYSVESSITSIKDRVEVICSNVRPKPPKISVEKLWKDHSGNVMAPAVDSISVELWRKYELPGSPEGHTVRFELLEYNASNNQITRHLLNSTDVAYGGSVSFVSWMYGNAPIGVSSTAGTITQTGNYSPESWFSVPVYTMNNVTEDRTVTILFGQNGSAGWLYPNQIADVRFRITDVDEPRPSQGGYEHELVDTVILNGSNNWSYNWPESALPAEYAPGIPYLYYVREIDLEGYETIYSNNEGIEAGIITITNIAQTVDLTIRKLVVGTLTEDGFAFSIVFKDPEGSIITDIAPNDNYEISAEGVVTFTLHDGESITITGLIPGTEAVITETEHDGYTVIIKEGEQTLYSSDSGSIVLNVSREITFVNSAGTVLPETGGVGREIYILGGFAIMLIAVIYGIGRRSEERRSAN